MPPTWGALLYHIKRSNCVSVTWERSVQGFDPVLPNPVEFGWALEDKQLVAKMTDELPAPEATIEL